MWKRFCETVLREASYSFEDIVNDKDIQIDIEDDAYELLYFYMTYVSKPFFYENRLRFKLPLPPLNETFDEMASITDTVAVFTERINKDCTKYFASLSGCVFALAIEGHKSLRSLRYVKKESFVLPKNCTPPKALNGVNVQQRTDGTWIALKDINFFDPIIQHGYDYFTPVVVDNKLFETKYVEYARERFFSHFRGRGPPRREAQETNDAHAQKIFEMIKQKNITIETALSAAKYDTMTRAKIACLLFDNRDDMMLDDTHFKKICEPMFTNVIYDLEKLPDGFVDRQQKIASLIKDYVKRNDDEMVLKTIDKPKEGNVIMTGNEYKYQMRKHARPGVRPGVKLLPIDEGEGGETTSAKNTFLNDDIKESIEEYIDEEGFLYGEHLCDCADEEMNYNDDIICKNPTLSCKNPFAREKKTEIFSLDSAQKGLKAAEPIRKDEFIIEYVGEIIDDAEFEKRSEAIKKGKLYDGMTYFFQLTRQPKKGGEIFYIDAGDKEKANNARYINSSCSPNAEQQVWKDAATRSFRVGIFAKRDIQEGEELTFLYDSYKKFFTEEEPCKCGSDNCQSKSFEPVYPYLNL